MPDEWIVITGWDKFQHYNKRRPPWIKNHLDLLRKDEYLDLTPRQRALLHGLWITYADRNAAMRRRTSDIASALRMQVLDADLVALNHAGFIEFRASTLLAHQRPQRQSSETDPLNPPTTNSGKPKCPECNVTLIGSLADHLANVHNQEIA